MEIKALLIADARPDMRTLIRVTLETLAISILEAEALAPAHELLRLHKPPLLLLDAQLQGEMGQGEMDGWQFCRYVKNDVELQHMRIILLSTRTHLNDVQTAFANGADDYLIKPFQTRDLLERVQRWLNVPR